MTSLKNKTSSGVLWSFVESFSSLGLGFVIGIILARLLSPKEYGLIGILTIFISISEIFVRSGISQALIRKRDCTDTDYSTAFYFNLGIATFFYALLSLSAGNIAVYFNEPILKSMLQVMGVIVIINSLSITQSTQLTKRVDFKLQTKISIISNVFSGFIGIFMAYQGYGVWSLVFRTLSQGASSTVMLWYWNKWIPKLVFSKTSFKELFNYGSKLLGVDLLTIIQKNLNNVVIAKYYSSADLGFYTRADMFRQLSSQTLTRIIDKVTFPVFSLMQDENVRLKANYQKLLKIITLVTFFISLIMVVIAEPLVLTLIGEKWSKSIVFLQLLSIFGIFYPIGSLNNNILKIKGRVDVFFNIQLLLKIFAIPSIVILIYFGIEMMIVVMILTAAISYIITAVWAGNLINYSFKEQSRDMLPNILVAIGSAAVTFAVGNVLEFSPLLTLILEVISGVISFILICEIFKIESYGFLREIVVEKLRQRYKTFR